MTPPAGCPIVMLWATPRTVSTAFERMMIERGDHQVFDEPYSGYYYFSAAGPSQRFDTTLPGMAPDQILERLTNAARHSPVFVKDMAYQGGRCSTRSCSVASPTHSSSENPVPHWHPSLAGGRTSPRKRPGTRAFGRPTTSPVGSDPLRR